MLPPARGTYVHLLTHRLDLFQFHLSALRIMIGFPQNVLSQRGDPVPLLGASRFVRNGHLDQTVVDQRFENLVPTWSMTWSVTSGERD